MRRATTATLLLALALTGAILVGTPAAGAATGTPAVRASPQVAAGSVVVTLEALPHSAFVVVQVVTNGTPSGVVGVSAYLEAGSHAAVEVPVQLDAPPESVVTLQAAVHVDDGNRRYDGNARDPLLEANADPVATTFPVQIGDRQVAVAAGDQLVAGGSVVVARAALADDGFVVVRRVSADGAAGPLLGVSSLLGAGTYRNLTVDLDTGKLPADSGAVPLVLTIHGNDRNGAFNAGRDPNVTVAGKPVAMNVTVSTLAPSLVVDDQTGNGNAVLVRRAVASSPTWLVVNPQRPGGGPDDSKVLASVLLAPGVHRNLTVLFPTGTTATRVAFASLHTDAPADGRYTGPAGGADPVVRVAGHELVDRFTLDAQAGGGNAVPAAGPFAALSLAAAAVLLARRRR